MKLLVLGAGGMLGRDLVSAAQARGHDVLAPPRPQCDITRRQSLLHAIRDYGPHAIINCAAFTDVDGAEIQATEAFRVNAEGPRHLANLARAYGATLLHVSTDYVFDGSATAPVPVLTPPAPCNVYGRSKLAGEDEVRAAGGDWIIARTSWLYGLHGRNFVDTILRAAAGQAQLRVVADQHGRPTWTRSLADALLDLLAVGGRGIFHVTDGGPPTTWHALATRAIQNEGLTSAVLPVATHEYPRPARRPSYSVLDVSETERVLERDLPLWTASLRRYLEVRRLSLNG